MDLLGLIRQDHDEMRTLFRKLTEQPNPHRESIRGLQESLADLLVNHSLMEERYLYPRMELVPDINALIQDSYTEHSEAKQLLKQLSGLRPLTDEWLAVCVQLQRATEQHLRKEEAQLFPLIERHLNQAENTEICRRMLRYREKELTITPDVSVEPLERPS